MKSFVHAIDTFNDWTGRIIASLFVLMTFVSMYEIVARYIFNRPTIWAWEINGFILCTFTFLTGGYVLRHGGHVAIELLAASLSPKQRNVLELVFGGLFFPTFGFILWNFILTTLSSIRDKETTDSIFRAPLYQLRVVAVIGIVLLIAQGLANFIRNLNALTGASEDNHER